jgi:hypothetical protein
VPRHASYACASDVEAQVASRTNVATDLLVASVTFSSKWCSRTKELIFGVAPATVACGALWPVQHSFVDEASVSVPPPVGSDRLDFRPAASSVDMSRT